MVHLSKIAEVNRLHKIKVVMKTQNIFKDLFAYFQRTNLTIAEKTTSTEIICPQLYECQRCTRNMFAIAMKMIAPHFQFLYFDAYSIQNSIYILTIRNQIHVKNVIYLTIKLGDFQRVKKRTLLGGTLLFIKRWLKRQKKK